MTFEDGDAFEFPVMSMKLRALSDIQGRSTQMGQVDETNFKNIYQDVEKVDYSYEDVNSGEFNHQWSNDDIH